MDSKPTIAETKTDLGTEKHVESRRNAAKAVIASAAVVAWHKPMLEAVVSPAHATTSDIVVTTTPAPTTTPTTTPAPMVDQVVAASAASTSVNILIAAAVS